MSFHNFWNKSKPTFSTVTKCRKPFDHDCMVDWFVLVIIKFHLDVTVLNLMSLTFVMISLYHTE